MNNSCNFNRLSVELLHNLFDYFSTSELFFTFYNINDYLNVTLKSYIFYQLDLQSISKLHFHFICHSI